MNNYDNFHFFEQMDPLKQFIKAVECCDFSEVKVFFIGSVPGEF